MKKQLIVLAVSLMLAPAANAAKTEHTDKDAKAVNEAAHAAPDNTKKNAREHNGGGVTAQDQSGEKSDVEVTRKLRQEILKRKKLSTNAQNVKIITQNGTVTLKGPVDSAAEKDKVERIAKQVIGANKLVNDLEVKTKTR